MRAMNKNAAIALARQNGFQVDDGRCVFSNVSRGPKNVWWLDVPVEKAIQGVAILLCDGESKRLYCLDVPGSVFRDNAGDFFREDVNGVDKFRIEPSASKGDFMKDRRPGSAGFCFRPFVEETIEAPGDEECPCAAKSNSDGVTGAGARRRFDASFPSVKIGIIMLAWSTVLQAILPNPFSIESSGFDEPGTVLAHLALLFAASAGIWFPVWKELHGKVFYESAKSVSFHVHVWATALVPLLAGYYGPAYLVSDS